MQKQVDSPFTESGPQNRPFAPEFKPTEHSIESSVEKGRKQLIYWCLIWTLLIFASIVNLQNNGPYYPFWTRKALDFKAVNWRVGESSRALYAADLGLAFEKDRHLIGRFYYLQLGGRLQLLANSKVAAGLSYDELPEAGKFVFKSRYLLLDPTPGYVPDKDGRKYELYFPPACPPALSLAAALAFVTAAVSALFLGIQSLRPRNKRKNLEPIPEPTNDQNDSSEEIDRPANRNSTSSGTKTQSKQKAIFLSGITIAALLLFANIYFSTGSLTPYNLFGNAIVLENVPFFTNSDHPLHQSIFAFIDCQEPASKMLLRRILFTGASYPLMKAWGYELGGVISSFILNVSALVLFSVYYRKKYGYKAGLLAAFLLAVFPGFAYYASLPYVYSFVLPGALAMIVLLNELGTAKKSKEVILLCLGLGCLNLGYDLLVFFAPAACLLLLSQKRLKHCILAAIGCLLPTIAWCFVLSMIAGKDAVINENTSAYANAIAAYALLKEPAVLQATLNTLPQVFSSVMRVFFTSAFYILPLTFAVVFAAGLIINKRRILLSRAELFILLSALAIFLFSNCAPDFHSSGFVSSKSADWQLKGEAMARLYLPVFVVYISYLTRLASGLSSISVSFKAFFVVAVFFCILANSLICFGPILNNPFGIASRVYHDFYEHAPEPAMQRSLEIFGRKPLGFFDPKEARKYCIENGAFNPGLY